MQDFTGLASLLHGQPVTLSTLSCRSLPIRSGLYSLCLYDRWLWTRTYNKTKMVIALDDPFSSSNKQITNDAFVDIKMRRHLISITGSKLIYD